MKKIKDLRALGQGGIDQGADYHAKPEGHWITSTAVEPMIRNLSRRRFLKTALAAVALPAGGARVLADDDPSPPSGPMGDIPIIDTHIHLFDPGRPQGVPWPSPSDRILYHPAVPSRYRQLAVPFGIRGAIEVECSPWPEDNQWVLDAAAKDTIMVGTIGDLEPGKPEFPRLLDRFTQNPLFRGIRYGNLWGRDLGRGLDHPQFVADLRLLAEAHLVLDTANPTPRLLADIVRLTDQVPSLRIVIDHLPALPRPREERVRTVYDSCLRELGDRPQVYVKISEILCRLDGRVSLRLEDYRENLDRIYEVFGPDRVLYGSDWPNSDTVGTYGEVLAIARAFFLPKGRDVAEKYFWKNSVAAYRWVKREPSQPTT